MESTVKANLKSIYERIRESAKRSDRNPNKIRLMAVTKTHSQSSVKEAYQAGIRIFGENKIQEAEEKYPDIGLDLELHFIGHLQSNKVKKALAFCNWIDSVDSLKLASIIDRRLEGSKRSMPICLEINSSKEESKYGYLDMDILFRDIEKIHDLPHIELRGLMTIGPLTDETAKIRKAFTELRKLYSQIERDFSPPHWDTLSMGMSSDFEIAIEEGSNLVRLGTILFGPRNYQ